MKLTYIINNKPIILNGPKNENSLGEKICLSKKFEDLIIGTEWENKAMN